MDRPVYNLHLDNLTNDDTDPLHADSAFTFAVEGTDEANSQLVRFGSWEVAPQAARTHTISLDLTGNVGMLVLQASGYSSTYAQYPVAFTVTGITANMPRPLQLFPAAVRRAVAALRKRLFAAAPQRTVAAPLAGGQPL